MHNTRREPDWRTPLAQQLIELRTLPLNDPRRGRDTNYVRLTSHVVMEYATYAALKFYEKRFVDAVAVGRNAYSAVLAGRSAARVLGMWVVSLTPEKVELALPSGEVPPTYRRSSEVVCRRRRVAEHVEAHGVRATGPVRTFIDIARDHGFVEGLIAADWLLANGYRREELYRRLRQMGRIRNRNVVRRCIECATGLSESPYESLARALFIDDGIGGIEVQARVDGYRIDLLIRGWLAVEIDGDVKYRDAPESTIVDENNRQKQLGNRGIVFMRYRPQDLRSNYLRVLREVRERLENVGGEGASRVAASAG